MLAMLMILVKHLLSLIIALRCFHKVQSGLEVDESLHLMMVFLNSPLENRSHLCICFDGNSSKRFRLT